MNVPSAQDFIDMQIAFEKAKSNSPRYIVTTYDNYLYFCYLAGVEAKPYEFFENIPDSDIKLVDLMDLGDENE